MKVSSLKQLREMKGKRQVDVLHAVNGVMSGSRLSLIEQGISAGRRIVLVCDAYSKALGVAMTPEIFVALQRGELVEVADVPAETAAAVA